MQAVPYVKKARETLPEAKKRYLSGLPKGEHFFVTTRLRGPDGKYEQVFVKVTSWRKERSKLASQQCSPHTESQAG